MFNKIKEYAGVVALVAIVLVLLLGGSKTKFGAIVDTSYFDYFDATTGFKIAGTNVLTATGLALTMSSTATSTATLGCIQTTATSTATPIRFVIGSGLNATTTYQGSAGIGSVVWQYGSCPI